MWESVLAKNPGFFEPFATARFYNSKGIRRCANCKFVTDAVRAQISIKKSRIFMRNGKEKPPMELPHTIFAIRRHRFYGIIYIYIYFFFIFYFIILNFSIILKIYILLNLFIYIILSYKKKYIILYFKIILNIVIFFSFIISIYSYYLSLYYYN